MTKDKQDVSGQVGDRISTPDGRGTVRYTRGSWFGVQLDGERDIHEWPARVTSPLDSEAA
jgi:hypothetical protein